MRPRPWAAGVAIAALAVAVWAFLAYGADVRCLVDDVMEGEQCTGGRSAATADSAATRHYVTALAAATVAAAATVVAFWPSRGG